MEQDLSGNIKGLKGEKSLDLREISDLKEQKNDLVEYCNKKKGEVEEQQHILNMMDKHQKMIISNFVGAFYIVLKMFEVNITRAMEVREMHEGDIA